MKRGLSGIIVFLLLICSVPLKAASQGELVIGLIPEENIFKQMDRYRPLAEYLSSRLGINVRLTILSSYGDIIDKFVKRKMDGAFFGALTGALAEEKLGIEPIARPVKLDGTSSIRSFIFVRKDSGIKNAADMKGKRMAFVDRTTVSYLFALAFFRGNGVKDIDSYFKEYYFTGSHDSAIYSVLDNRADIGAAESKVYDRMVKKYPGIKEELNILAESGEFPDTTLYLTKDLPVKIKETIKNILLNMAQEAEGKEVLKKLEAMKFIEAAKQDSLPLFVLAKKAGVTIQDYKYKK
jgi:phosphonate transport system substrate-binding protein